MAVEYDSIVVGLGASGIACASELARAGRRVLGLEAQSRLGGRVYTVPLEDGVVELGAEWIHGTEGSSVYKMAVDNNVRVLPQDLNFKEETRGLLTAAPPYSPNRTTFDQITQVTEGTSLVVFMAARCRVFMRCERKHGTRSMFRADGGAADSALVTELMTYCLAQVERPPPEPAPLGRHLADSVQAYIATNHPHLTTDADFIQSFLHFMDQVINNYESSNSWCDVSTMSSYEELGGHQHMSWHELGYGTLFNIMLNKYNNGPGLPTLTIKLNAEVIQIKWPKHSSAHVEVTTADGNTHTAQNVIVTVSLGVLKERHATLFSPPLPQEKVSLIERLSIGVVNKITFLFDRRWWPERENFFGFLWRDADETDPCDVWTRRIFACSSPLGHRNALTAWTSGDAAKMVETLSDEVVRRKVLAVIQRFMGGGAPLPEPVQMFRSGWYSNRFTRGSYSYDNTLTPHLGGARRQLGDPLGGPTTPRLLFAGEATDPVHFSTVHGAVDAGKREASRLLNVHSKM